MWWKWTNNMWYLKKDDLWCEFQESPSCWSTMSDSCKWKGGILFRLREWKKRYENYCESLQAACTIRLHCTLSPAAVLHTVQNISVAVHSLNYGLFSISIFSRSTTYEYPRMSTLARAHMYHDTWPNWCCVLFVLCEGQSCSRCLKYGVFGS